MNNVLILVDSLDDWKPYSKTNSILTVSDLSLIHISEPTRP